MIGMSLTFNKLIPAGTDSMNNPIFETEAIVIEDCLVAPIIEPVGAREEQAMKQSRDQVRIHLPKATTEDVSNSDVVYDGKTFHLDSDSVIFMAGNVPTRWNRYFRAEAVNG